MGAWDNLVKGVTDFGNPDHMSMDSAKKHKEEVEKKASQLPYNMNEADRKKVDPEVMNAYKRRYNML